MRFPEYLIVPEKSTTETLKGKPEALHDINFCRWPYSLCLINAHRRHDKRLIFIPCLSRRRLLTAIFMQPQNGMNTQELTVPC